MRFTLSTLLGLALCLPAVAQRGPGPGDGPRGRGGPPADGDQSQQLRELSERLRALEAKLKAHEGDKKVEVVVVEKKDGDKKPEPRGESRRDGERRQDGPPMGGFGGGGFGPGPGGPPMGGFGGGRGGFGGGTTGGPGPGGSGGGTFTLMLAGHDGTPPGFDKLTAEEQKTFRGLMAKMHGGDQPQVRVIERRTEGTTTSTATAGREERKPSVEQRLDQLERAIGDIKRMLSDRR